MPGIDLTDGEAADGRFGPRAGRGISFLDDDGEELVLDGDEADALLAITDGLEPATVSACPDCRSRVIATVAFVDLLDDAPPHARASELLDFADEAPTLHLFVVDESTTCRHPRWRDPLHSEWDEIVDERGDGRGRPHRTT